MLSMAWGDDQRGERQVHLFRVSSIDRDSAHAFQVQQRFAAELMTAMSPAVRSRVSGLKPVGAT
jgi:hypothetical protein